MRTASEKAIEVLNDLILVNNDRSLAYEKAARQTAPEDSDLQEIFNAIAADSRRYSYELANQLNASDSKPAKGITLKGNVYQVWADAKIAFTGNDRHTLLATCESGEDAILKAYNEAVQEDLPAETKELIIEQKNNLRAYYDRIKKLRDMQQV